MAKNNRAKLEIERFSRLNEQLRFEFSYESQRKWNGSIIILALFIPFLVLFVNLLWVSILLWVLLLIYLYNLVKGSRENIENVKKKIKENNKKIDRLYGKLLK